MLDKDDQIVRVWRKRNRPFTFNPHCRQKQADSEIERFCQIENGNGLSQKRTIGLETKKTVIQNKLNE